VSSGFEILWNLLGDRAGYRVRFDRDKDDRFSLKTQTLTGKNYSIDPPPESQLLTLLPQGSNWSPALGWRSFFGVPYRHDGRLWLALGMVKILEHDHRGAFPKAEIYLLDVRAGDVRHIFDRLSNRVAEDGPGDEPGPRYGAVLGNADEPAEHRELEGHILRSAGAAYADGNHLLFRTAILTENEIPGPRFFRFFSGGATEESPLQFSRTLYGTVPSIYRNFRWSSKLQVFLERGRRF
jgi:hypothetical protein